MKSFTEWLQLESRGYKEPSPKIVALINKVNKDPEVSELRLSMTDRFKGGIAPMAAVKTFNLLNDINMFLAQASDSGEKLTDTQLGKKAKALYRKRKLALDDDFMESLIAYTKAVWNRIKGS